MFSRFLIYESSNIFLNFCLNEFSLQNVKKEIIWIFFVKRANKVNMESS